MNRNKKELYDDLKKCERAKKNLEKSLKQSYDDRLANELAECERSWNVICTKLEQDLKDAEENSISYSKQLTNMESHYRDELFKLNNDVRERDVEIKELKGYIKVLTKLVDMIGGEY